MSSSKKRKPSPEPPKKRSRPLKELDPDDPNDHVFELITKWKVPIATAMCSGITVSAAAMYARVARWKERTRMVSKEALDGANSLMDLSESHVEQNDTDKSPPAPSATITPATRESKRQKGNNNDSIAKVREAALDNLPDWMDRPTTSAAMSKRKKRSMTQTAQDNFDAKARCQYYATRFKNAWKAGTKYYHDILNNPKLRGTKGFGARSIAKSINDNILNSPNDRKR